jgi:hypothetical protein
MAPTGGSTATLLLPVVVAAGPVAARMRCCNARPRRSSSRQECPTDLDALLRNDRQVRGCPVGMTDYEPELRGVPSQRRWLSVKRRTGHRGLCARGGRLAGCRASDRQRVPAAGAQRPAVAGRRQRPPLRSDRAVGATGGTFPGATRAPMYRALLPTGACSMSWPKYLAPPARVQHWRSSSGEGRKRREDRRQERPAASPIALSRSRHGHDVRAVSEDWA